ncbi:hypothetical protein [Actinoplanes auranticolor]|uniref:Uncharacterized protein n=1 Tax=Actinoplanes auranticolor TaxID=47988 RepID=A0A919VUM8_9ACTN|nr:hypothetical protein Aau02nite_86470 [Actinoplanes auranticolor]
MIEVSHPAPQVGTGLEQGISHPGQSDRAHLMAQALLTGADRARVDRLLEQVGSTAPRSSAPVTTRSACGNGSRSRPPCWVIRRCAGAVVAVRRA